MEGVRYIDTAEKAGWNYLYEDCFEGINQIINENLKGIKHNKKIVNEIFKKMLEALDKANEKIKPLKEHPDAKPRWSYSWDSTFNNITEFSKLAYTINKKVITINMIDQFLRCTF